MSTVSCGELSCEDCNKRRDKLIARIEAEKALRESDRATIADLRDEVQRSERLVEDILATARRERDDLRAEVRRLEDRIRALEDMFVEAAGWRSADNPTGPEERIRHEGRAILARRDAEKP